MIKVLLLLVYLNIVFSSCNSKKIYCKGFTDSFVLQWLPYRINEEIVFKNNNNLTETLTISEVFKSEPGEIKVGGYNNVVCIGRYDVFSKELDTVSVSRLQIFSHIFYKNSGEEESRSTQLIFFRERFDAEKIVDTGFVLPANSSPILTSQFFTTLTLNTKTFSNVQELKIDTNFYKPYKLRHIYISRGNGVVAYIRYPTNELYVKQ